MRNIYWADLPNNKFFKKPHPDMLRGGLRVEQELKLLGSPRKAPKQRVRVLYDRRYVKAWLLNNIYEPLEITSLKQLDDLLIQ